MNKHSKFVRDLQKLDNPALHRKREKLLKQFMDESTDSNTAADLLDQLDAIEEKLTQD